VAYLGTDAVIEVMGLGFWRAPIALSSNFCVTAAISSELDETTKHGGNMVIIDLVFVVTVV
jgi:hypothetical protein